MLLLPIMFGVTKFISNLFGLEDIPVVTLALFHTTFNVLGVVLMWPFTERLTKYLEQQFVSREEIEGKSRYLDKNVAVTPALALNALALELGHIGEVARRMSKSAISTEKTVGKLMRTDRRTIRQLAVQVGSFVSRLERSTMPKEIAVELSRVLRTSQYYLMSSELASDIAKHQEAVGEIKDDELSQKLSEFKVNVINLLDMSNVLQEGFSITDCDEQLSRLNESYDVLKTRILEISVESGIDIASMSALLEQNSNTRRLVTQMVKAARYLSRLFVVADIKLESTQEGGVAITSSA